jgi:peptidyl-prolyl cis-trans isomerase D
MLDFVRTKQKSILIKIAFGLIILSFVIGYTMLTAPTDSGGGASANLAARVNNDEISYNAFQSAYSNLYSLYQNIYQGSFNKELEKQLGLPQQALKQLISESLLVQEAERRGIAIGKQELIQSIAGYEAFQENGVFNRNRYLQVLNYQRMTPEEFEGAQQRQLLTSKVREQLQQDVQVTEEELQRAFHNENDKVNLEFVWLTPALVESKVKVEEAGLAGFFAANQEMFRQPEKIALRYLQFDPVRYEKEVTSFSDEELDRYYRRNLDLYEIKEQVKASHILLRVAADADEATVQKRRTLAEELLKQLKGGADFAQLAKLHSDDKGTADAGGELGYFPRGVMVGEFEKAAFDLRPGQLSEVAKTPFGFHIIKVDEYIEPGVKPLVDVIAEIKDGLKVEKARQLAYEKAMDAYNINRKTGDLEAAAQSNDLGVKETGFFGRDEPIDGIGLVPAVSAAAFNLTEKELARPVQTTQGIFLVTIKDRQPSRLPELAEVRSAVEQAYRAEQAQNLARELADQLLASATEKKSLTKAAAELRLKVETSGEFSRSYGAFVPRIGASEELAQEAFSLTPEAPISAKVHIIENKFLVASLKDSKIADFASLGEPGRKALEEQLLATKKEAIVADKIQELLNQARIEILIPELSDAIPSEKEAS